MSEEAEYGLVMPFVVVTSKDGPYDDEAYCAGWEMGALAARLALCEIHGLGPPEVVIHRGNVPQADLIAMQHGMVVTEGWPEGTELDDETNDQWARVTFAWGTPPVNEA